LGFSQITRTTPPRLTILHLAQILRTDERTFISCLSPLGHEFLALAD
jgi:hypothetical protein